MRSVSRRSTVLTCQLPASVGELASLFKWCERQQINLRRIDVQSSTSPSPQFKVKLEMDSPKGFPPQIDSVEALYRLAPVQGEV